MRGEFCSKTLIMRIEKPNRKYGTSRSIINLLSSSQSESPTSSPIPSSPATTPPSSQKEISTSKSTSNQKTLRQTYLSIGLNDKKTCQECGMSYLKNIQTDIKHHEKYHQRFVNGIPLPSLASPTKVEESATSEFIIKVNSKKSGEVSKTLDLLQIVNQALNAPDDNDFWMDQTGDKGAAFIYVKDKTAIGIVTIIKEENGRWYSIDDGRIVSNKKIPILCGISRIFVASSHRRRGIAVKLLDCVRKHMIYGAVVPKSKLSWSQPSFSGGKLAATYNGVKHKTGRILIPVYKENRD